MNDSDTNSNAMDAAREIRDDEGPAASPSPRRRGRSVWRDRAEHALFRLVGSAMKVVSPSRASRVGGGLARLFLAMSSARRRILFGNLRAAFPHAGPDAIASLGRRSVDGFGRAFVEFLDSPRASREEVESRVEVAGAEHLQAARARGKGVFLLSAHLGSWEFGAIRAGLLGEPIASVVRPLDNPLLEAELAARRTRFGNALIRKKNASREILKRMRAGGTVAILVDQNVLPHEGVFVPFFGRLAATTPSLALLQMKTDAAVVPSFVFPNGDGRYRLEFQKPILAAEFEKDGEREDRIRAATARYMAVTEEAIRRDPAAWLWIHNRWRTRPEGE